MATTQGAGGSSDLPAGRHVDQAAAWIWRSAGGDHDAFARLYDATADRAYGVALRVLRDGARAEEVVQEAYLQVWQRASRFDPVRGSAMSWILTIVHHGAVTRVRAVQRRRGREAAYHGATRSAPEAGDETFEAVCRLHDAATVHAALVALTPTQRTVIELAYFEALTYREVAARLGIPAGTAKTRIRAGLHRLRVALTEV